jgi:hypothetical protein
MKLFLQIASPCLLDKVRSGQVGRQKMKELFEKYHKNKLTANDLKIFNIAYPGVLSQTGRFSKILPHLGGRDPVITYFFSIHPRNLKHEKEYTEQQRKWCTPRPAKIISREAPGIFKARTTDGEELNVLAVKDIIDEKSLHATSVVFIHQGRIVANPQAWIYNKAVKEYEKYLRSFKR